MKKNVRYFCTKDVFPVLDKDSLINFAFRFCCHLRYAADWIDLNQLHNIEYQCVVQAAWHFTGQHTEVQEGAF